MGTEAVIRAFCINALAINTTIGVLTFIHIKALQFDGVIVRPLLTVAFVTRLSVQTEAIFADFLPKEHAFVCIFIVLTTHLIRGFSSGDKTFPSRTHFGEFSSPHDRAREDLTVVPPPGPRGAAAFLFGDVGGQHIITETGVVEIIVAFFLFFLGLIFI